MATPFQLLAPQRVETRITKINPNEVQIPVDVLRILVTELSPYELIPWASVSRYVRRLATTETIWAPKIDALGIDRQAEGDGTVLLAAPKLEPRTALDQLEPPPSVLSSYNLFVKCAAHFAPLSLHPQTIGKKYTDLCERAQIVGQLLRFAPVFAPELYYGKEVEQALTQQHTYLVQTLTEMRDSAMSTRNMENLPSLCEGLCALGDSINLESLYLEAHPLIHKYYQSRDPERFLMEEDGFGRTLDSEIFGAFFKEIALDLNYYGKEEIDKLFPVENKMWLKLYRVLVDQVLYELLSNLFAVLKLRSEIEYLKLVPAVFTGLEKFATNLVPCENSGPDVANLAMEELSAACESHIGAFLPQQRLSFRESLNFKVNKWNRSLAANESERERIIWSSVPRQVDKKNFLSSFKNALMLRSDVNNTTTAQSTANLGKQQRKPSGKQPPLIGGLVSPQAKPRKERDLRRVMQDSDDSEDDAGFVPMYDQQAQAGNEFFMFGEQSDSEDEQNGVIGAGDLSADAGDLGNWGADQTEQPTLVVDTSELESARVTPPPPSRTNLGLASASTASDKPRTELEAQIAILTSKLQEIDQLFSLELTMDLINDCKREINQLHILSHFGSHVAKLAQRNAEMLFVDLLQILDTQHVHYGFSKALDTLRIYDPKKFGRLLASNGTESVTLDPLVVFAELVNVGDLIQQTLHVFFEQQLVAPGYVNRDDFVAPSVIAKRKFEKQLDESVSEGLSLGIDALMDQAEFILITEQLGSDFCPAPGTDAMLGPTTAAEKVMELIKAHIDLLSGSLDESMIDVFEQEVGLRLFGALCKHLKRSIVSIDGAITLISDMNAYYRLVLNLKQRALYPYYEALKEVAQLYLIAAKDGKQLGLAISDMARFRGVLPPEEILEFMQRRQDWPQVKSKVERAIYGIADCIIA